MPRFLIGDELGSIKSVHATSLSKAEAGLEIATLRNGGEGKDKAVQRISARSTEMGTLIASAHADGTAVAYTLQNDALSTVREWIEPRLKPGRRYVGLAIGTSGDVFSCTSNGALRQTKLDGQAEASSSKTSVLPMRLCDWKLAPGQKNFAYAGQEVELSVWDIEKAFTSSPNEERTSAAENKKRKRDDYFPGETWRAKNVANDGLDLRQPVRNTCLTYLSASSPHHIAVGTFAGSVRKYDTRAQRKPVASWDKVGKVGGIMSIERGFNAHELFVADQGSNLYSIDTRNGKIAYGYKGIAGAISSIAASPTFTASTSLDRYFRLHSTFPPAEPGQQQDEKGQVLENAYFKSIPTVVVWDQDANDVLKEGAEETSEDDDDDDNVWDEMEQVEDEREGSKRRRAAVNLDER